MKHVLHADVLKSPRRRVPLRLGVLVVAMLRLGTVAEAGTVDSGARGFQDETFILEVELKEMPGKGPSRGQAGIGYKGACDVTDTFGITRQRPITGSDHRTFRFIGTRVICALSSPDTGAVLIAQIRHRGRVVVSQAGPNGQVSLSSSVQGLP